MHRRSNRSVAETAPPPQRPRLRLVLQLPPALGLVRAGTHVDRDCTITVEASGLVAVVGPARSFMFDAVERFLKPLVKNRPPFWIPMIVYSPPGYWPDSRLSGQDSWMLIVMGSEFAFTPTALPPEIPALERMR